MRTLSNVLTSALLLAATTLSSCVSKNSEVNAIKGVVQEYERCCRQEDLGALAHVFANDPDTVMISAISPRITTGWEAIEEGYRNFFQNVDDCEMQFAIHTVKILADGKAACLTAHQEASMRISDREVTFADVRMTWFLEKQDGHWRIVNTHWSVPQQP